MKFEGDIIAVGDLTVTVEVLKVKKGKLTDCATVSVDLSTAEEIEGSLTVGNVVEVRGWRTDGCNVEAERVKAEEPEEARFEGPEIVGSGGRVRL